MAIRDDAQSRSTCMQPQPSNGIGNSAFKRNFPFVADKVSSRRCRNASLALRARLAPRYSEVAFRLLRQIDLPEESLRHRAPKRRMLAAYWLFHSGSRPCTGLFKRTKLSTYANSSF